MNNYRENLEIDLKDLFFHVIKHYKILISAIIIGCVLGSILGIKNNTVKEESSRSLLTNKEIYEVNSAVVNYKSYFNRYSEILEYKNNSPLMKIDGYHTPTSTCSYLISDFDKHDQMTDEANFIANMNNSMEKNVADNIISLYSSELKKADSKDLIKKAVDKEIEDNYISELYSITKNGYSIMTITTYGRTIEESNNLLQQLTQIIEQKEGAIKESIPHKIIKSSLYSTREKSSYIISSQDSVTNQLKDLNNAMISVTSNLSADQKSYFKELLAASDIDYGIERIEETKPQSGLLPVIKYGIMGCIAAGFLVAVFFSLTYILSPTIKVEDDLKHAFQIPVIGSIHQNSLDKNLLVSSITAVANVNSANKVCIVSSYSDEIVENLKTEISKALEDKGLKSMISNNIINDSNSLDKAISSDAIILLETIQKSKYEDISKIMELCKNYHIILLGSLLNYE